MTLLLNLLLVLLVGMNIAEGGIYGGRCSSGYGALLSAYLNGSNTTVVQDAFDQAVGLKLLLSPR